MSELSNITYNQIDSQRDTTEEWARCLVQTSIEGKIIPLTVSGLFTVEVQGYLISAYSMYIELGSQPIRITSQFCNISYYLTARKNISFGVFEIYNPNLHSQIMNFLRNQIQEEN